MEKQVVPSGTFLQDSRRAKFRDTHRAFGAFDGPDGNGVIGLREFEEGMRSHPGSFGGGCPEC